MSNCTCYYTKKRRIYKGRVIGKAGAPHVINRDRSQAPLYTKTSCKILKYPQMYNPYQNIVGQKRDWTHRDLVVRKCPLSSLKVEMVLGASLLNHTLVGPLSVVGNALHMISTSTRKTLDDQAGPVNRHMPLLMTFETWL